MVLRSAEEAFGESQSLGYPVHHDRLQLRAGGRAEPIERGGRERRRVHLAQDAGVSDAGREESHEIGRLPVRQARFDLGFNVRLYLRPFFRLRGRVLGDLRAQVSGFNARQDALGGEAVEVIDYCYRPTASAQFAIGVY